MSKMDWTRLMSRQRLGKDKPDPHEKGRSPFERDIDRLVFSPPLRRLHDKTQVFPFPQFDYVHSRLTHSLEASRVGRSLGAIVGEAIVSKSEPEGLTYSDFGAVVAAACLAHDIGHPPFGHAGEEAIRRWFVLKGKDFLEGLTEPQREDLLRFESNAQGFRILARLQWPQNDGGMQLTCATLAALTKYPRSSFPVPTNGEGYLKKKHGYFDAERELFRRVAEDVGLKPLLDSSASSWCRHPLAFLVEAADDICYAILDVEDGYRLGHIAFSEVKGILMNLFQDTVHHDAIEGQLKVMNEHNQVGFLRAKGIGKIAKEVAEAFVKKKDSILDGTILPNLTECIASKAVLENLRKLAEEKCYRSRSVIQIETAGYNIIEYLLDELVPAVVNGSNDKKHELLRTFLPVVGKEPNSKYEKLLRVTDFISGMTDTYALGLYRRLRGVELPFGDA